MHENNILLDLYASVNLLHLQLIISDLYHLILAVLVVPNRVYLMIEVCHTKFIKFQFLIVIYTDKVGSQNQFSTRDRDLSSKVINDF